MPKGTFRRKGHKTGGRKTRRRGRKTQKAGAEPIESEPFRAIKSQSVEGVHDALDHQADAKCGKIQISENTPLIQAVHTDQPKLVQLLIDAGAQVDTKGS